MEQRINYNEHGKDAIKAMYGLELYLAKSSIERHLLHLIKFRVSQINGCAYCLDMHSRSCAPRARPSSGFICWMPGVNRPFTPTANARRSDGPRR